MFIKTYSDMLIYLSLITFYIFMHKLLLNIFSTNISWIFFPDIIN